MVGQWLTDAEFQEIYSKVPRLTVEVIVKGEGGILLTKRAIEPFKGCWHLPGGTVRFGELMAEAVARVAQRELGVEVEESAHVGYIDYPSYHARGLGSPVGLAFEVQWYRNPIRLSEEASEFAFFRRAPNELMVDQVDFLMRKGYLTR